MIWLALILQVANASPPEPQRQLATEDIVVVARRNVEAAKHALDACIARQCPPDEEVKAAIIYAARQFLAGDYAASRRSLLASRHRNARFAKSYPVQISDLHRALNNLSNLTGYPDSARISAFDAADALRAGLPADDPLILLQRLDTGRQLAHEGRFMAAVELYENVASKAQKKGYHGVEAQALFRGAALYAVLANVDSAYRSVAQRWRDRIADRTDAEFAEYRDALGLLDAQIARLDDRGGKRILPPAATKPVSGDEAVLLSEPVVRFAASENGLKWQEGGNNNPEWADVAFWVKPDGSVANVAIIGRSKSPPGSWLPRKVAAVSERRYAPLQHPSDSRGVYRVERYSMVFPLAASTQSRMPTRSARGQLETTDVTTAHRPPPG